MAQNAAKPGPSDIERPRFTGSFSSFSTDDIARARQFYKETLGLDTRETKEGLELRFGGDGSVFIYPKSDHAAANFTVLNLKVADIRKAVEQLRKAGIEFESYTGEIKTDDDGIMWGSRNGGPNIAWFRDPAGNFISVIEE